MPSLPFPKFLDHLFSHDESHSEAPVDLLAAAALIYLAIPNVVFLGGWLQPWAALFFLVPLFLLVHLALRDNPITHYPYSRGTTLVVVTIAAGWSILGGAGHFFNANPDWVVRDAVYGDLIQFGWPPAYDMRDGHPTVLRSAIGFFLPTAALAKALGLWVADVALYLWTALGVALFLLLLPLQRRLGVALILSLLVVIFFSGMDFLGVLLMTGDWPLFPLRLEWWTYLSYSSFTGALYWGPNHCIPLLITTALFYRHWKSPAFLRYMTAAVPLTFIWTPFVAIGMLPYLAFAGLAGWRRNAFQRPPVVQLLCAAVLGLFLLRYLSLAAEQIPIASNVALAKESRRYYAFWESFSAFALFEFGILALAVWRLVRHSYGLFWLSVAILAALPFLSFGPSNDSLLRLSAPPLAFLAILTFRSLVFALDNPPFRNLAHVVPVLVILLIGALTPFNEMWRAATWARWRPDYGQSLRDTQNGGLPVHYFGKLDRPDLLMLFRPAVYVPSRNERRQ